MYFNYVADLKLVNSLRIKHPCVASERERERDREKEENNSTFC
jgi:hypothetical protein